MTRYAYATRYDPPAPALPVRVGLPNASEGVSVEALVDTGADLTVVPQFLAGDLGLPFSRLVEVEGADGVTLRAPVFAAEVEVEERSQIYEVLALGTETLLGRNVLESLVIRLDGPGRMLEVGN